MSRGLLAWAAIAAVVAGISFIGGRALKGGGEAAPAFDLSAPGYSPADTVVGSSLGGFSGFGETGGLEGEAIVAGRVSRVGLDSVTVAAPGGESTIRLTGDQRLRRIEAVDASALTVGASVVVIRKPGTDQAASVLVTAVP